MELWNAILERQALLVDIGLILLLGTTHIVAWATMDTSGFGKDPEGRSRSSLQQPLTPV